MPNFPLVIVSCLPSAFFFSFLFFLPFCYFPSSSSSLPTGLSFQYRVRNNETKNETEDYTQEAGNDKEARGYRGEYKSIS